MRPINEATKQAKLMDLAGRKYVAELKICRRTPKNMSLRNSITSLHGTMFTEMLLGDLFLNKSLLKFVVVPRQFKIDILQQNNGLCMQNSFTKKYNKMCDFCRRGIICKSWLTFLRLFRPVGLHFY